VKNGKFTEAMMWAKEITEYVKAKYSQPLEVYVQVLGDIAAIHWLDEYKDLAAFESVMGQIMSDQEYWAVVNKGVELFIDGSWNDTMMRAI
jgi:hypothetical protein